MPDRPAKTNALNVALIKNLDRHCNVGGDLVTPILYEDRSAGETLKHVSQMPNRCRGLKARRLQQRSSYRPEGDGSGIGVGSGKKSGSGSGGGTNRGAGELRRNRGEMDERPGGVGPKTKAGGARRITSLET